jgi:hypothetical protein
MSKLDTLQDNFNRYNINTIEDAIHIIRKRYDIPEELRDKLEDTWANILLNENYEDDFYIETLINELNKIINIY